MLSRQILTATLRGWLARIGFVLSSQTGWGSHMLSRVTRPVSRRSGLEPRVSDSHVARLCLLWNCHFSRKPGFRRMPAACQLCSMMIQLETGRLDETATRLAQPARKDTVLEGPPRAVPVAFGPWLQRGRTRPPWPASRAHAASVSPSVKFSGQQHWGWVGGSCREGSVISFAPLLTVLGTADTLGSVTLGKLGHQAVFLGFAFISSVHRHG